MTPAQMRSLFWKHVGLPATAYDTAARFESEDVDDYLHEAIMEFCDRACPVQLYKTASISLVSGTSLYNYPSDFWRLRRGYRSTISGVPVERCREDQIAMVNESIYGVSESPPSFYYDAGVVDDFSDSDAGKRQFGVWPVPSTSGTMKLYYLREPIRFDHANLDVDTDQYPDLPRHYHRYPVLMAAHNFYLMNGERPAKPTEPLYQIAVAAAERLYKEVSEDFQGDQRALTECPVFTRAEDAFLC